METGKQGPDRLVQLGEAEEAAVAQGGEDPALGDEHRGFDDRLVSGPARSGGHDGRAVVLGELEIGAIDDGVEATGVGDPALEIVWDEHGGSPAEELHHPHVGGDPGRQILGETRLGVEVAARPEHADEQLDDGDLAGGRVGEHRPLAGEVDERFLASAVDLAHRRVQPADPLVVVPAELAVAVAVAVRGQVLQVQPLQRDPRPLELLWSQAMSGIDRGTPTRLPTRWNRRASSWASSHSVGTGHVRPACRARQQ